jgi:hypothetical protein
MRNRTDLKHIQQKRYAEVLIYCHRRLNTVANGQIAWSCKFNGKTGIVLLTLVGNVNWD